MPKKTGNYVDTQMSLLDGFVGLRIYTTLKDLRKDAGDETIYARYSYEPAYNRIGVIYLSKESPIETIVHEIYHAVEHYKRLNTVGLFRNPDGLQSEAAFRREERFALLFAELVRSTVDHLEEPNG